ncbi:MAG: glutathione S-transferase family protein [Deltaproteobacteria bacterium]|nr:glutathione S-transferase family protein [Deltaproteobacteria bacterium]MBW2445567.1 glutathione S-transferase family protein [Deltaproteobacteria bacterium]
MIELYHNAFSSCSQKVRIVLGEKGIGWKSHEIDLQGGGQHDPEYVKLNPNHVVPTLVHDGRVFIESTLINEYLDDEFPNPPLRPGDPVERHAMRLFVKHIDEKVHPAAGVITYGIATRPMILGQPPEVQEAAWSQIPDPARRAARKSVIENGIEAPEMRGAVGAFIGMLDEMEATIDDRGPWVCGEHFSLADACALPYVLRLEHLAMGSQLAAGVRPRVARWFAEIQALESYEEMISGQLLAPILAMFQKNAEEVRGELDALIASL